jgi:hypothetical protein
LNSLWFDLSLQLIIFYDVAEVVVVAVWYKAANGITHNWTE